MTASHRQTLCVVPAPLRTQDELDRLVRCTVSLCVTVQDPDVLVVLYGDTDPTLLQHFEAAAIELELGVDAAGPGEGHAAAANRGLRLALEHGADAVLIDPASELSQPSWLPLLTARAQTASRPIGVVGARMVKPDGTIHRAGFMFSRLTRCWQARLEWAPATMPEGLPAFRCPVGGGVELIRHEALVAAYPLDVHLPRPLESVDFCLRTFAAGLECVVEPAVTLLWNGRPFPMPSRERAVAFDDKWHGSDFRQWVPAIS